MFDWFWSTLSWLGIYNKRARLLFLGLDNAGKTTLLHMLKYNRLLLSEPTRFPHDEEITIGNIRFKAHDVGGHTAARRLWKQYMTAINGIIFIIDSTDYKRFFEAKNELYKLLNDENLQEIPFLILGSKFDSPIAVTEIQLRAELGLEQTSGKDGSKLYHNKQPVELFMSSVVKRTGYQDGFNWLNQHIK